MNRFSLTSKDLAQIDAFRTSARRTILSMLKHSQSGHPGGSLSCIDYLSLVYTKFLATSVSPIVISNGHISPAVYAVLAEMGYVSKRDVIHTFRKIGSPFEGHVTRHVKGVWYGTGPLGVGVSAATGFAFAEKQKPTGTCVYALMGDGEMQEGQVYEMMHTAAKYALKNLIVFVDYNQVQLTDSLKRIMPIDPVATFKAAGWQTLLVPGHDIKALFKALTKAHKSKKPTAIIGQTIMGKGVDFMEKAGKKHLATWHGKAPSAKEVDDALALLPLTDKQQQLLKEFRTQVKKPRRKTTKPFLSKHTSISYGTPRIYNPEELTDCRTAYGKALLDLAIKNPSIVALTADVSESVKTSYLKEAFPNRHIDVGIAEQQMVSMAGGMSLHGLLPFTSTFGAFLTSRAKDQARVNDINQTNVKMVATHCGLSVGEDGPTHQAIDDMGSFLGFFHTAIMEPADPNQTDRIIRYAATHHGNMYVRMGRHKIPVLTNEKGDVFFDDDYHYYYGRCDLLRSGTDLTIAASGPMVSLALEAREVLAKKQIHAEIVIMTSPKVFDEPLFDSITKTGHVLTVEDHNSTNGYAAMLAAELQRRGSTAKIQALGVEHYQLSGKAHELYDHAGIGVKGIVAAAQKIIVTKKGS